MGSDLRTIKFMSTQSFCLSERLLVPPRKSFYLLKLLITTPTNRLRRKKEPKIMKPMKKKTQ